MSAFFKKIALIGKHKNPDILAPLLSLANYLISRDFEVVLDQLTAAHIGKTDYPVLTLEEIGAQADLAVVARNGGERAPQLLQLCARFPLAMEDS